MRPFDRFSQVCSTVCPPPIISFSPGQTAPCLSWRLHMPCPTTEAMMRFVIPLDRTRHATHRYAVTRANKFDYLESCQSKWSYMSSDVEGGWNGRNAVDSYIHSTNDVISHFNWVKLKWIATASMCQVTNHSSCSTERAEILKDNRRFWVTYVWQHPSGPTL